MLQFLKKTGRRKSIAGSNDSLGATEQPARGVPDDVIDGGAKIPETDEEALRFAERHCFANKDSPLRASKLSRRMIDILTDQSCMCYFVQYLESRNALSLIKFWLDVESFKAAAVESSRGGARPTTTTTTSAGQNSLGGRLHRSVSSDGYDSLSFFSVDGDSLSTNSFSENAFEDTQSVDDLRETDSRTSQNCTPLPPPTPLEVLEEVDIREELESANADSKMLENGCDMTIMRQSLTDDEKKQICEAGKAGDEPTTPATTVAASNSNNRCFNSLINSDAVRIYRKYLTTNSPHHIDIPATVLSSISLALCSNSGICNEQLFSEAQHYLLDLFERSYLNPYLESSYYCKYTLEVLTDEHLKLRDILGSEMALFYFMEHLEQQGKRHYLEFYVAAVNFRRSFESSTQAQKDAVVLYDKYFSLQATCSLLLSDQIRFQIEEHICSADAANVAECFELPGRIIELFLEQRYFAGFLKSPLYCRFISELLGKVKTNTCNSTIGVLPGAKRNTMVTGRGGRGHRKTLSDVTSDSSGTCNNGTAAGRRSNAVPFISSQNTLLAMPDASFHRNRKHMSASHSSGAVAGSPGSTDMQIDSRQLYNPDLLWRRNSTGSGLTFGRVDALGRYERDFDIAEPPVGDDRWNRSRLKKAVRKLVNLPEDKAQEELAWQVAEMIVKDITNVTMNHST
ncbi:A-kinase anchor protein 10, mitochondrial-like [Anopheles albimanus]|uniref:A-kinase anchor protein 10, mitochondrial-like n=1 Tax=Anopheles albimanus TaxID=7167 RepID=UPI00163F3BAD|nr:A-kinase anchor protein 10, mitochondrial-like [Anopheles albimanus]